RSRRTPRPPRLRLRTAEGADAPGRPHHGAARLARAGGCLPRAQPVPRRRRGRGPGDRRGRRGARRIPARREADPCARDGSDSAGRGDGPAEPLDRGHSGGRRHHRERARGAAGGARVMRLGIVLLAFAVIGCGADAPGTARGEWAGSIADSAGIHVVTNPPAALWEASEAWTPVEDLVVSDRATPGLEFGEIIDVDVDSRGRIL